MKTAEPRRRRGRIAGITAALAGAVATVVSGAAFAVPGVTPASVSATLLPGQSNTITKSVETSPIPPRPDILFLADTTGSMDSAIANVQANATSIMNTVRAAQAVSWRAGSSRIIVWFGDASGHDPSGGHTLAQAIAALQANGIRVIAINVATGSPFSDGLNNTGQATAVTSATGGSFFPSATPAQVSNAILSSLQTLPVTVTHSVSCPAGVFANLTPASQSGTSGQTFPFSETYGVNAG